MAGVMDHSWLQGIAMAHTGPKVYHKRTPTSHDELSPSGDYPSYTVDVDEEINLVQRPSNPRNTPNYTTESNVSGNNEDETKEHVIIRDITKPSESPMFYMDLSLGFRYLTHMYRYNLRPLIYVSLSFIIMLVPALYIEDKWYSLIPCGCLLCFNAIFLLCCLICAISCTSTHETDEAMSPNPNQQNSEHRIPNKQWQNMRRRASHMSNVSNISEVDILDLHRNTNDPVIINKANHDLVDSEKMQNCVTTLICDYADVIDACFGIRRYVSRIEARISPPFSGLILVFSTVTSTVLCGLVQFKYNDSLFQLCPNLGNELREIRNGECLIRKIQLLNLGISGIMSMTVAAVLVTQVSKNAIRS